MCLTQQVCVFKGLSHSTSVSVMRQVLDLNVLSSLHTLHTHTTQRHTKEEETSASAEEVATKGTRR